MEIKKEPEDVTDSIEQYDVQWRKYKEEFENNSFQIKTEIFDDENGIKTEEKQIFEDVPMGLWSNERETDALNVEENNEEILLEKNNKSDIVESSSSSKEKRQPCQLKKWKLSTARVRAYRERQRAIKELKKSPKSPAQRMIEYRRRLKVLNIDPALVASPVPKTPTTGILQSTPESSTRNQNYSKMPVGCNYVLSNATPLVELQIDEVNIKQELMDLKDTAVESSSDWTPGATAAIKLKGVPSFRRYFVCNVCFDVFPTTAERESHENLHRKSIMYSVRADYGDALQIGQSSLMKTENVVRSGDEPYKCDHCDYACIRLSDIKQHRLIHSGEEHYACDQCDYFSNSSTTLSKHKLTHTGEKSYKCDECEYSCVQLSYLKCHKLKHSGEKPFKCEVCDYSSIRSSDLKKHNVVHFGTKPFKCDKCEYSTNYSNSLKIHKKSMHSEEPLKHKDSSEMKTNNVIQSEKKYLTCHACPYSTTNQSHMKVHKMIHSGEKPFKCEDCEYLTAYSWHMKTHRMIHSGDKPFKCQLCSFECRRSHDLKLHNMAHSRIKQFKCDRCEFSCLVLRAMKQHKKTHSVEMSGNKTSAELQTGETPFVEISIDVNV